MGKIVAAYGQWIQMCGGNSKRKSKGNLGKTDAAYGQWIAARSCLWSMDCCLWKQCVENGLLFRTWIEMDIWLFDMVTLIFDSYLAKE